MKPKTMILMGLAITCGLGASYMTSRLLAERANTDEPEKVEILVARKNLSVHQKIHAPEEFFEKKLVSRENEPADAIRDFDTLKGKSLRVGRMKGDHVTAASLYDRGALEIPEGHQAVGVRVNIETTASGLASLPGSQVDLLLTIASQEVRGTKTVVLLESVLVLFAPQIRQNNIAVKRFFQTDRKAVLVASRDQRRACRRAYGGIGVSLRKAHTLGGQPVDVGRLVVSPAVAGEVGVTQVVG